MIPHTLPVLAAVSLALTDLPGVGGDQATLATALTTIVIVLFGVEKVIALIQFFRRKHPLEVEIARAVKAGTDEVEERVTESAKDNREATHRELRLRDDRLDRIEKSVDAMRGSFDHSMRSIERTLGSLEKSVAVLAARAASKAAEG